MNFKGRNNKNTSKLYEKKMRATGAILAMTNIREQLHDSWLLWKKATKGQKNAMPFNVWLAELKSE